MMLLLSFGEGLKQRMDIRPPGAGTTDPTILWAGHHKPWQGLKPGRPDPLREEDAAPCANRCEIWRESRRRQVGHGTALGRALRSGASDRGPALLREDPQATYPQRAAGSSTTSTRPEAGAFLFLGPELKSASRPGQPWDRRFSCAACIHLIGIMIDKQQNGMYRSRCAQGIHPLSPSRACWEDPLPQPVYTTEARPTGLWRSRYGRSSPAGNIRSTDESAIHFWDTRRNRRSSQIHEGVPDLLGVVGAMTLLVPG